MGYASPSKAALAKLESIFGERFSADPEDLVVASYDATKREGMPGAVVWPISTEEVAALVRLANEEGFAVAARGAASGLTGGAVPAPGSVVADLTTMDAILEIDRANLTALVEPGVIVSKLQAEVERLGLFYPPDPASDEFSTIGGNIAECAGGLRGLKYGVTRDYVLELTAVTGAGDVIRTGSNTIKSVTGYDITRLIVGSEGTLAIITKARLKLIPLPEGLATAVAFFASPHQAGEAVSAMIAARLLPRALEFVDGATMGVVAKAKGYRFPQDAQALLIIEVDGAAAQVPQDLRRAVEIARANGAIAVEEAYSDADREKIWAMRKQVSPSLYSASPDRVNEDIVVPRSRIPEMLDALGDIARRHGLTVCNFAHAGDGNIHVNFLVDLADRAKAEAADAAVDEVFKTAMALGGTLSGEHGIGLTKKRFLGYEVAPLEMRIMREIKKIFDPKGVLNPGKIFPEE
jgi:glycolate oxidase